jgi:undecaprenyl diphosphate synthase
MSKNEDILNLPTHLGLILDGNRRWAKEHGIPKLEGQKKGYQRLKKIDEAAIEKGIKYVSAYVFSVENWNRSKEEVSYLMNLLLWVSKVETKKLAKKNIKVVFSGSKEGLSDEILRAMDDAEKRTTNNDGGTLVLCLNYGGKQEITDAVKNIIKDGVDSEEITTELISKYLYEPNIPDVDLIIRTSGEQRLSGFQLWESAYSELKFVKKYWPAFNLHDLDKALLDYSNRKRRFGA